MTFRDDHEALVHRTDALEREAERLRRENEELRERAAAHDAERADLRALAASPPPVPPPAPVPAPAPTPTVDPTETLRDRSLVAWWGQLGFVAGLMAMMGGVISIVVLGQRMDELELGFAVAAANVLFWTGGHELLVRRERRQERRWLAAPPVPLDVAAYLRLLGDESNAKVVTVWIRPSQATSPADRELIVAAARNGPRVAEAAWAGDDLFVRSTVIETSKYAKSTKVHDNAGVHGWVRELVDAVVIPTGRIAPLHAVTVSWTEP